MNKLLSVRQKAAELNISLSGLRKTRHLYKHIKKSPHKYLYFAEDPLEAHCPITENVPQASPKSRRHRRRNVPFGQENYHNCPAGSGNSFQLVNQMRAKASLEGKMKPEEISSLTEAMAIKIKDNHKEIVDQKRSETLHKVYSENERIRKKDPSRYGTLHPRGPLIDISTPWKDLYEKPKTEYDLALEELGENSSTKKYYEI